MEKKQPLLTVRPHFDQGMATVQAVMFTAAGVVLVPLLGGTILYILFSVIGLTKLAGYVYGLLFIASLIMLPPLFFEMKKKAYSRTVFRFFDDHLDFQYFQYSISMRRGRVRYRDISDVTQHANALQENRRLMTISLYVPSMGYHNRAFAGVQIHDVQQKQDYVTRIMTMIEQSEYRAQARANMMAMAPAPMPAPFTGDAG